MFREIIDRIKEAGEYIIRSRLVTLIVIFIFTSSILVGRVFYLQIVRGEDYLENYELKNAGHCCDKRKYLRQKRESPGLQ